MLRLLTHVAVVCAGALAAAQAPDPPRAEALAPPPPAAGVEPESDQPEPAMNNRRLGKLLAKLFPGADIQGQPGFWQIRPAELPEEQPAPADENGDAAEEQPQLGPGADDHLPPMILVITDERADRMRIMMPIRRFDPEQIEDLRLALIALQANHDRALDARYALHENTLWSAFLHPLGSLTPADLASALRQVQALRRNTGTTYSSGELFFGPGRVDPDRPLDEQQWRRMQNDPNAV